MSLNIYEFFLSNQNADKVRTVDIKTIILVHENKKKKWFFATKQKTELRMHGDFHGPPNSISYIPAGINVKSAIRFSIALITESWPLIKNVPELVRTLITHKQECDSSSFWKLKNKED